MNCYQEPPKWLIQMVIDSLGWQCVSAEGTSVDGYPVFYSNIAGSFWDDGSTTPWLNEGRSDNLMYGAALAPDAILPSMHLWCMVPCSGKEPSQPLRWASSSPILQRLDTLAGRSQWVLWRFEMNMDVGDIEFDVSSEWILDGECDGCGMASFQDEVVVSV